MRNRFRHSSLALAAGLLAAGCRSGPAVPEGIQPAFEAINPSRIAAVPVFVLPSPARAATVDLAALETSKSRQALESQILQAFKNQPAVNGISYATVRQLQGQPPVVWQNLQNELSTQAKRLSSTNAAERSQLSKECLARKSIVEFYALCLAPHKPWVAALNAFSARVLNADSALLTLVSNFEKLEKKENYVLTADVAVLLVDTNSGKLIWGRERGTSLARPVEQKSFPEPTEIFARILDDAFWADFPGRKLPK